MLDALPRELELPIDEATIAIKTPPHSIEAEQSVLGGLMLDNQALDRVGDKLTSDAFYNPGHRLIYAAISTLSNETKPFDPLTVAEILENRGELDDVGGLVYLAELSGSVPSVANISAYADIIFERSVLRKLINTGQKIADSAYHPEGKDSKTILDEAERLVFNIAEDRPNTGGPVGIREILDKTVKKIDELFHTGDAITGVTTGFKDLDVMTSGLQASDMVIVAARPSMGKCIVSGSRVIDPETGVLEVIDDIVARESGALLSLNDDFRLTPASPTAFVDDGFKPVFKVTTALGRTIETTLTHPFLSESGWQQLGALKAGDRVAVPRALPVFGRLSLAEHKIKALAYEKELPEVVYQLGREQMALFLRHLFACDGSAFVQKNGQCRVSYSSSSFKLVSGVQHLLLRFGINAKVREKVNKYEGAQVPYELEILNQSSLKIFINEIGIFAKEDRIAAIQQALAEKQPHDNSHDKNDTLPDSVCDYILKLKGARSWREIFTAAGVEYPENYNP
nr:DnaB-like helicase N-terminal domain-containing protein [Endozoicomonas sp.]